MGLLINILGIGSLIVFVYIFVYDHKDQDEIKAQQIQWFYNGNEIVCRETSRLSKKIIITNEEWKFKNEEFIKDDVIFPLALCEKFER